MRFLANVVCMAFAVWIATAVDGVDLTGDTVAANVGTLLAVAVLFGVINAVLKPLIHLAGCLFYVLTLGIFALVVNGLLFWLTGWLADRLELPFHVDGFWPGLWGALIVAVASFFLGLLIRPERSASRAE